MTGDHRFIWLAEHVSGWSKDPSTQTEAVIVRPNRTVASVGFNGFPRGIEDRPELLNNREEKYKRVIHGEMNAILSAKEPLDGHTLYLWPGQSCSRCAVHVIQSGISRVVYPEIPDSAFAKRWDGEIYLAELLFREAGVEIVAVDLSKLRRDDAPTSMRTM